MNKLILMALIASALVLSGCTGTVNPGPGQGNADWCPVGSNWSYMAMPTGGPNSGSMKIEGKVIRGGVEMCHAVYRGQSPEASGEMHFYFTNTEPPTVITEIYQNGNLVSTSTANP
ncbi:MAG: hypothetical protein ABIA76_05045 [Candidatus Diapherotrites archaeon]